jgi:hypothetical protein
VSDPQLDLDSIAELDTVRSLLGRQHFVARVQQLDGPASAEVARRCLDRAVVLAPGNVFSVPQ